MIASVIRRAHAKERKIGICGQASRDYPELAAFLVEQGIDNIAEGLYQTGLANVRPITTTNSSDSNQPTTQTASARVT